MKIAIATCLTIPEIDVDEEITLQAFRDRGHEVELKPWDDPSWNAGEFDAVIIRSTWNYPDHVANFRQWIQATAEKTKLLNPADILLGNLEKTYLNDVAARGIPVVESRWINTDDADRLMFTEKSVLKPTIGAGSMDTKVFEGEALQEARDWLKSMGPNRAFMIQSYMRSVDHEGEQSIVMIGDMASHRIHKHPRFADGHENVEGPFEVSNEFEEIAQRAIEPIRDRILYARVDLMLDNAGKWAISELELVEPSLFLSQKPDALELLVRRSEQLLA
jgi:hypothetical protein